MKSYTITVNGTAYDVVVEETDSSTAAGATQAPKITPAQKQPANTGAGAVKISASVPGKVFKIIAKTGDAVKAGDTIVIVESMKMEIPVVAPQDGTVASIDVSIGDSVENGDILASMN